MGAVPLHGRAGDGVVRAGGCPDQCSPPLQPLLHGVEGLAKSNSMSPLVAHGRRCTDTFPGPDPESASCHNMPLRWSEPCDVASPGNPSYWGGCWVMSPWEAVPPWFGMMFPRGDAAKLSPSKQGIVEGSKGAGWSILVSPGDLLNLPLGSQLVQPHANTPAAGNWSFPLSASSSLPGATRQHLPHAQPRAAGTRPGSTSAPENWGRQGLAAPAACTPGHPMGACRTPSLGTHRRCPGQEEQ